ncbi:MAG: PQQ-dependent sugar dehydrogenase [Bacteroidota bacterium]
MTGKATIVLTLLGLLLISMVDTATSVPPGAVAPYLNGVFPEVTPGFGGSWYLEQIAAEVEIDAPLDVIELPNSPDVLIVCKTGRLWRVNLEAATQELVLDITDRTVNYSEAGLISLALHPDFPAVPQAFLFYRYKPQPEVEEHRGYNRLVKFIWDAATGRFDPDSEEILIQQYDRSAWHNGGGLFFEDGLLYLALGDEGGEENRKASNQSLSRGFFSGLLRIDVDNNPNRSHPIRRQPIANAAPPAGWPTETYSQGYSIPNDNPWQDEAGGILEEFFALGIRSPYSTHFDRETKTIWLSDVGTSKREEINHVEKGDNLQWDYLEGADWAGGRPDSLIGNEKEPLFHYGDELGSCIIGGGVYRGTSFLSLTGQYVFGDYVSDKIMVLRSDSAGQAKAEVLLSDINAQVPDLPAHSSISGIHYRTNGEILVSTIAWPFREGGRLLRLRQRDPTPDPPVRLSELGVFSDMVDLEVAEGIFPYAVNAPLWSDRALKRRWMAVPNDGQFDQADEQIIFRMQDSWQFPEGTVFIKHFELPGPVHDQPIKLETRFFVIAKDKSAYGLTYKWNEEQTEAFLLRAKAQADYSSFIDGTEVGTQEWGFPGRDQCLSCHNANANFVLGVNTHQLNSEIYYPSLGRTENQLQYLSDNRIIDHTYDRGEEYPKAYGLDEFVSLDERIRSYLDANCSSCHRLGGVSGVTMDLRFHTPLEAKNIVNLPTRSQSSGHNNLLVQPGNHQASELWIRDQSTDSDRMPPIGRNLVDEQYVATLAEWIDSLAKEDPKQVETILLFPNPSRGWLALRANEELALPLQIDLFSTNGQLVHTEISDNHYVHLELKRAGAGIFALRVRDAAGTEYTQQVIIQP